MLGVLVVLALALITVSFREQSNGPLHDAQAGVAGALQPLEVAVERVARPFRDAYGWTKDLFNARSENERLKAENEQLQQQVIQNESALQENVNLRALLDYKSSPAFPADYEGVAAEVISQPSNAFDQTLVVSAGSADGVVPEAPVVTADGLVGIVTRVTEGAARVRLLTDEQSAVSALDLRTRASGIVRHGPSGDALVLDRVFKREVVKVGDEIVTAGWRVGQLASLYPKGIKIGRVTFVGRLNTDLYQQVLVVSDVDFSTLDSVIVLVAKRPPSELP
ncbi:MAG TPA: rod shape-determining protein MreC [Gaiellaceae bacterium]|nr:rod shape-determining protein MreC [Gaiellaceae bacterium]